MLDQIAAVDEVHRLADVDARRPARNVAGDAFAAIEDIEALDTRFGILRGGALQQAWGAQQRQQEGRHGGRQTNRLHGVSSSIRRVLVKPERLCEHNNNMIMRRVAGRSFWRQGCWSKPLLPPRTFC